MNKLYRGRWVLLAAIILVCVAGKSETVFAVGGLSATNRSAAETYTEDTTLNLVDIVVTDTDSGTVTATLTLSSPSVGSLSTSTSNAVTSTYNAGTGVWTASGATADVNILLAGLTFTPALNGNGSFTIATDIADGTNADLTGTKAVTGVPTNDAPILDASKTPVLGSINASATVPTGAVGVLVSSLVDFATPTGQVDNVTDIDSGATLGVAITAVDSSLVCYYSLDGGTTWNAAGTPSGTSSLLLAADSDNRVYCIPGSDMSGAVTSALTIRAWDRSTGTDGGTATTASNGGTTAFSTATDTIGLTVNAVVPGAPVSLTSTAISTSEIDLSWSAPAGYSGSAITGYTIERESPTGNGFSTLVANTGSTVTTYADTGRAAGTQYNYRVSAINGIGTGTASNESAATALSGVTHSSGSSRSGGGGSCAVGTACYAAAHPTTTTTTVVNAGGMLSSTLFARTLMVGSTGADVRALQVFLNAKGFTVSATGAGSPGNETTLFGAKTKAALKKFQEANAASILTPVGLTSGSGFFGASTMRFVNALMNK